jgi:hypothetical protein
VTTAPRQEVVVETKRFPTQYEIQSRTEDEIIMVRRARERGAGAGEGRVAVVA